MHYIILTCFGVSSSLILRPSNRKRRDVTGTPCVEKIISTNRNQHAKSYFIAFFFFYLFCKIYKNGYNLEKPRLTIREKSSQVYI